MPLAPVPVLPVDYSVSNAKPGIITAVGIVSIVIGSLGMLVGLVSGLYAVGFTIAAAVTSRTTMTAATPAVPTTGLSARIAAVETEVSATELEATPRGLPSPVRRMIVAGLTHKHLLNDEKQNRLHELLAKGGQEIFPAAASGRATATSIADDVTESAELPAGSGQTEGPIYFVVGTGKIELYDDHAVFFPTHNASDRVEPIRVARGVSIDEDDVEAAVISGGSTNGTLTPRQVQAVVNQAQSLSGNRMNLVQLEALTKELNNPAQQYIDTSRGATPPVRQVQSVSMQWDSSAQVSLRHGSLVINPSGQVVSSATMNTGTSLTRLQLRTSASVLTLLTSAAGLMLAIYLLIVGIVTLRQRPTARRLHLIYAVLKLPVGVAAAVGWYLFVADVSCSLGAMAATSAGGGGTGATTNASTVGAMVFAVILGLLACAYPLALLIVMNTRTVRSYYRVTTAPAG